MDALQAYQSYNEVQVCMAYRFPHFRYQTPPSRHEGDGQYKVMEQVNLRLSGGKHLKKYGTQLIFVRESQPLKGAKTMYYI
jgi:hypothetical protein